ncbi:MAG: hypothetical protein AAFS03_00920 [Pseudomonadota bacterium]
MRRGLLLFGFLFGGLVVIVAARHGYMSADALHDRVLSAAWNGGIALATLFGPAVALRIWRIHRVWSLMFSLIALSAMLINLTNTFGFLSEKAAQSDAVAAELMIERAAERTELDRLVSERTVMLFTPTTSAVVQAARVARDLAEKARADECQTGQGPRCARRTQEAAKARSELVRVEGELAKTMAAARLDDRIAAMQKLIAAHPLPAAPDAQGRAIARLLGLPPAEADRLAAFQKFGMAVIVELLIIVALVAAELMRSERAVGVGFQVPPHSDVSIDGVPEKREVANSPAPALPIAIEPKPEERLAMILADLLEPSVGCRVEIEEIYLAYVRVCEAEGQYALQPETALDAALRLCRECGIQTEIDGSKLYVCDAILRARRKRVSKEHISAGRRSQSS